jgi:hypothetical protein
VGGCNEGGEVGRMEAITVRVRVFRRRLAAAAVRSLLWQSSWTCAVGTMLGVANGVFLECSAGGAAVWRKCFWSGQAASTLTRARFCSIVHRKILSMLPAVSPGGMIVCDLTEHRDVCGVPVAPFPLPCTFRVWAGNLSSCC